MYDELAERLREKAGAFDYQGWIETAIDYELAADAIEELSREYESIAASLNESVELVRKLNKQIGELQKQVAYWQAQLTKSMCGETLAELEKPRWIPATERLPREELCFYLCYTDEGVIVECLWTNNRTGLGPLGEWGWRFMDVPSHQHITHWMPLPEPPKEVV